MWGPQFPWEGGGVHPVLSRSQPPDDPAVARHPGHLLASLRPPRLPLLPGVHTWPGSPPTLGLPGVLPEGDWPSFWICFHRGFWGGNWAFLCHSQPSNMLCDLCQEYGLVIPGGIICLLKRAPLIILFLSLYNLVTV